MVEKTFHEIEHAAWSARASEYDDLFASVSTQAISDILDSLGFLKGKRHLDVACGTGHLVAAASARGAISEGIDFAEPMIEVARATYPKSRFQVADATDLPYDDQTFDAVTCAFGLLHMENPQAAVHQAFRVLKSGGSYGFTLWLGAEDGNEIKQIIQDALTKYITTPFSFPPQWTQLREANEQTCEAITRQAGFCAPSFKKLPIVWQADSMDDLVRMIGKLSVRTKMVIENQPAAIQQQIHEHIRAEAESRRSNGLISLAWPALLTVVQKPSAS